MKKTIINEKGFTLIELLIVVAIIGILAAIAIPAFLGQQKKAKTKALESTCSGTAKSAGTHLKALGDQDPIVFQQTPALKICFAHINKTIVDTTADGTPDLAICAAKYNDAWTQQANQQGTYGVAGQEAQEIVEAMIAEACGPSLAIGALTVGGFVDPILPAGGLGQNRVSPYYPSRCIYSIVASGAFAASDTDNAPSAAGNEGTCVLEYANATRSIRVIMVDSNGTNTGTGETKVYPAITGD